MSGTASGLQNLAPWGPASLKTDLPCVLRLLNVFNVILDKTLLIYKNTINDILHTLNNKCCIQFPFTALIENFQNSFLS